MNETVGPFRGRVIDNDDPDGKCRIKVEIAELLEGDTGWCAPALPFAGDGCGFAFVPPVDATVLVAWPRGDLSAPPVWLGASYEGVSGIEGAGPDTLIVMTPGGHRLELSDQDGTLTITCSEGPVITMDSNGITLDNGQGATIALQGSKVDVNDGALVVM